MREIALKALDALGLALVNHGHVWTDEERALYEGATAELSRGDDEDVGDKIEAMKRKAHLYRMMADDLRAQAAKMSGEVCHPKPVPVSEGARE